MTFVTRAWPRLLHPEDAADYVGGKANLSFFIESHGLKPVRQHKSNTVFDIRDLDAAIDALKTTEPTPKKKKKHES